MIIMVIYMTLKKWKVISCIGIFLLSALLHFIYDWFPFLLVYFFLLMKVFGNTIKLLLAPF